MAWPTGLTALYTDSNPLLSLPLKVLRGFLANDFQFTRIRFFTCIFLHAMFANLLVRRHAPAPWARLLRVLLLSMPPALYQGMGHDTLLARWTILLALWIFLKVPSPGAKALQYAAMLGLTALIHPYLTATASPPRRP